MEIFIQFLGWTGAFLVFLSYFLASCKKIDKMSRIYQLMNLVGFIGVGIMSFHRQAWPSFSIQIVWGIIAVRALIRSKKLKLQHRVAGGR